MGRAVQLCCRRYQPSGVSRALPWSAVWMRLGLLMVVGVKAVCLGSRVGLGGWAAEVRCAYVDA